MRKGTYTHERHQQWRKPKERKENGTANHELKLICTRLIRFEDTCLRKCLLCTTLQVDFMGRRRHSHRYGISRTIAATKSWQIAGDRIAHMTITRKMRMNRWHKVNRNRGIR